MDSKLMHLIAEKLENNEEFAIITVTASDLWQVCPGMMVAVDQYGQILGGDFLDPGLEERVRSEALKSIGRGITRNVVLNSDNGSVEIFINAFCQNDKLIIIGSGNLVLDLYQIAVNLGYRMCIIDDRAETLTRERFPMAELLLGDIVTILESYSISENDSIIISSYHHEHDAEALQAVIYSPARYIGVLANRRAVTAHFSQLNTIGVPDELLNKVHTPIGLDLGGQKTSEIALSALAEIQAVKYGRSGEFLSIKYSDKGKQKREELF